MIWAVLLLVVSVGLLVASGVVEVSEGFYKALPLSIFGFTGLLWAFYLYAVYIIPFIASPMF